MRVLAVTKIFPNSVRPLAEPNMRQQYCALARLCELRVLATIPWYPGASLLARWSPAGSLSAVPPREIIAGLAVDHPRYLLVPVVGLPIQAHLYAASVLPSVWAARRDTDIIFSTFVYPDGVAAVLLGRLLRLPVVIEALGTDVNVVGQRPVVRRLLRRHLPDASRIVAVSRPLARSLCDLGARPDRVDVLPTGVDRSIFYPRQRGVERARLAVPGDAQVLLYVGNLVREKGIEDLVVAFQQVSRTNPKARLYVAGEGPLGAALSEGEEGRRGLIVRLGRLSLDEVALWLGACDVLVLPSWAEGTPNVIMEALASGRRVVATRVGGIPDLVVSTQQGWLCEAHDPSSLREAVESSLESRYDPNEVANGAQILSLEENARHLARILEEARREHAGG